IGLNDSNVVTNNGTLTAVNPGANGINFGNFNLVTNNAAIVVGAGGSGLAGADNNVVVNNGTITAATFGKGIFAGVNNTITNAATGVITVGDDSSGIYVAGNSTVTNAGAIFVHDAFSPAAGIFAINDFNTLVNAAGATITGRDGAAGLALQGNDATVTNAGTITVRNLAPAILVQGDRAVITNTGSIVARDNSAGISVSGDSDTIVNRGTITVRDGVLATGIASLSHFGSNSIFNTGTINVGANATGISTDSVAGSNSISNTGTINVGTNGIGIFVTNGGTVFNSGTINAAAGFAAIEFCGCGTGNVLTLGPGSVINGFVLGAGTDTLRLGGTGKDTFNLSLIGPGLQYDGFSTFNKVDSSSWTVIGTGAQDWNVLGGTLSVNGTINGLVTVAPGGTLGGTGTIGNVAVSGGTLAPGNSIGTLNITGSLTFSAASSYMVEISGANSDLTRVGGVARLGGATVVVVPSGTVMKRYTILTATGGVPDTFNPVVAGVSSNLNPKLGYDANNVYLSFALNYGGGLNTNQQNVGNALTNFFNTSGGIPVSFASLTPAGLTQVSGELATSSQQATFDAMNLFLSVLTDPFIAGRGFGAGGNGGASPFSEAGGANAYAAKRSGTARDAFARFATKADVARNDLLDPHWSVWGSAYGGGSNTQGNGTLGSNSATARAFGFAAGADYRISPDTLVGFALAGGGTNFSVSGFGTGRSDLFQAGAFVRRNFGAAYVTAAAAYGWQDVTTDRTVTAAGVDRLRAEFNANAYSGRVEGGYRYATPWMGITPYAAGQFTTYSLPAYAEQVLSGAGTFALNYAARDVTASRTELGVRTDKSFAMQNGILTLRGRAAWAHDFNTDRNVTALFQTLPGASFVVNGAAQAHDSALLTGAAEMKWLNGWSAAAIFEGQFSSVTNSYAGKGIARYHW
ncbi:MAG: autotransporter outer membrane beta-barrel domain-containing protein, partial [Phreatobacter sp.]